MEALEKLLQLPYQTLAILVAGYLAYRLAYTGRDSRHKTLDTAAIVLAFAFIAQAASAWLLATYISWYPVKADVALPLSVGYCVSFGGIITAIIAAAIWRKLNNKALPWVLRKLKISAADRNVTAWETIISDEDSGPSSITIVKKDGTKVMSERLADFRNSPFGPAVLGEDGSVAIYVSHFKDLDANDWDENEVEYEDWGPEITVIPASEIAELRIRHSSAPSILKMWGRNRRHKNVADTDSGT